MAQSSFIRQPYRRKHLDSYCKRMSTDNLGVLYDDNVASVLLEQGFSIKESPRSIYKVEKLYQALDKYAPNKAKRINMRDIDVMSGLNLARVCFSRPKDQPKLQLPAFTPELVYSITSNHKGSAGLTAWGQTKAESYVRAYERAIQQIKGIKRPEPCVAFKRTQFNDKTRLVWGYPYAMTAEEGVFARPLIERFKLGNTPMAFGKPTYAIGSKIRVAARKHRYAYSTDVSSFDASCCAQLIRYAFDVLSTWFDLSSIEPTTGVEYRVIWNQIREYFINTPIFMPDGYVYKGKKHGVPSGSYFTQMIDSVINIVYCGAISSHFSLNVEKDDIQVLGDDLLFWSNRDVSLEQISNYATSTFNATFNADKSAKFANDQVVHYLGRDWPNGYPTLPEDDIIARMVFPETYRKYSKDPATRDRQVRMLFFSYAAVYKDAYPIYTKTLDIKNRFAHTNASMQYNVFGKSGSVNPEHMSGLQRYLRKYVNNDGGNVPLALQYWK